MICQHKLMLCFGVVLMASAFCAVACRETADLGETSWELVAYGPADAPISAEAPASIRFENNGRVGGFTGCNAFSGRYEAQHGRLTFRDNEMAFTLTGCGALTPEGSQDDFFRERLGLGANYSQTAERLTLYFDEGRQVAEYRVSDE